METPTGSARRNAAPLTSTLVAVGLTIFGIVVAEFTTLPALLFDPVLFEAAAGEASFEEASREGRSLMLMLNFVGYALAGAIYLAATGRGWSYVDLRVPTKRGWMYVVAGIVGIMGFYFLVSIVISLLSLPSAENTVMTYIGDDPTMVLIMIAIVFFFNAPAEEFLFRNVVQKRLYEAFSRIQAVVIASLIFALVHVPVYYLSASANSLVATLVPVTVVFGGALIFGYLYAKSENLLVPIASHAIFNAFQFFLLYLALEYDLDEADPSTSVIVDAAAALL